MKIAIEDLELLERCQARTDTSAEIIEDYAAAYREGVEFPPVDVWIVDGERNVVVDGWHRVLAMRKVGVHFAAVTIVGEGDEDAAAWTALRSNRAHGLRRSNEDKRRAVRLALSHPHGGAFSSRAIADHVGVGDQLVRAIRTEMEAREPRVCDEPVQGKDGKHYKRSKGAGRSRNQVRESRNTPPKPLKSFDPDPAEIAAPAEPSAPSADVLPGPQRQLARVIDGAVAVIQPVIGQLGREKRGLDEEYQQVLLEAQDRIKGAIAGLKKRRPEACPRCEGKAEECFPCQGRGWVMPALAESIRRTAG